MKFAVGYQLADGGEESFVDVVADYAGDVAEVYFPWGGMASGRAALTVRRGYVDWGAQGRVEDELRAMRTMGVKLDLLFNANCYGGQAVSEQLANQVASVLEHLADVLDRPVDIVTTTSPMIARVVKGAQPEVEVRASVNMRIGTTAGMRYMAGLFDSFYVQRDYNRDLDRVGELKKWADGHGKGLYMLANSGCLAFCSGQTFHDNMVAHEQEIDETRNVEGWTPMVCWQLLKERGNWPVLLQGTWVRPEDLWRYEGMFDVVKLATRMHSRPRMVIDAYVRGRYAGNLLDLFEPGYGPALAPMVIDNGRFPGDWFERTSGCGRLCEECGYCERVLGDVLVDGG